MYTLNRSGNWQKIPCVEYYSPSKLVKANEYKRYLQRILKAKKQGLLNTTTLAYRLSTTRYLLFAK